MLTRRFATSAAGIATGCAAYSFFSTTSTPRVEENTLDTSEHDHYYLTWHIRYL